MVRRMDNVGIVVEDIDAAIEFFTELGLELEGVPPSKATGPMASLDCATCALRLPCCVRRTVTAGSSCPDSCAACSRRSPHAPVNALGYLRVMFTVEDIDDTLARLGKRGAKLVGEVVQYQDTYRLCYIRGPEGILIGLAQELGQQTSR